MMVAHLTGSGDCPLYVGRMPRANTCDFPQTLVRLSGKLFGAPSTRHTLEAVTFCNSDAVDHLVLLKDAADLDRLLKKTVSKPNLVRNAATVHLNFHQMCLLLLERCLGDLSVGKNANDGAVLLDPLELTSDGLATVLSVLLGVLGEGFALALIPVLVETAFDLVAKVLCPDGSEGAETARSLDVANNTNCHHLNHLISDPLETKSY